MIIPVQSRQLVRVQTSTLTRPVFCSYSSLLMTSKVDAVHVADHGSHPRSARVDIEGLPAYGVVDSRSDIMIMGGDLLCKVTAIAKLQKKDFKPPDKIPETMIWALSSSMRRWIWQSNLVGGSWPYLCTSRAYREIHGGCCGSYDFGDTSPIPVYTSRALCSGAGRNTAVCT